MTHPKRFYKEVTIENGQLVLDGKPVKTKGGLPLAHPSAALMHAVAEEWEARQTHIRYQEMPLTRLLMASLELDAVQRTALSEHVLAYAPTDLLCYLSTEDSALAAKQHALWYPWLEWLDKTYGVTLHSTYGIVPVVQPPESLCRLQTIIEALPAASLVALNELTVLLGSLVLALGVLKGALTAAQAFDLSVLDETYQAEHWGEDEAATLTRALKRQEAEAVFQFFYLLSC